MSTVNRREYLTATVLDQALLDRMQDNLEFSLHMVADIETPTGTKFFSNPTGNIVEVTDPYNVVDVGDSLLITASDDPGMIGQTYVVTYRTPALFRFNKGSPVALPTGFLTYPTYIRASDTNKYIVTAAGRGVFYEALCEFPPIKRTMGEWLNPALEFSTLTLSVSNVDGRYNKFLAAGAKFDGWVGKTLLVRLGLRDVESTYFPIFRGTVTDIGGFQRDRMKITLITRDTFDKVDLKYPKTALAQADFPELDDNMVGTVLPYILGDWTYNLVKQYNAVTKLYDDTASIPGFAVNGKNLGVLAGTTAVRVYISENDNLLFDTAHVYIKKSDIFYKLDAADITPVSTGNRIFDIKQGGMGGISLVDSAPYQYDPNDKIFVRVKGKDLGGGYSDNIVWQARDILMTQGGVSASDLGTGWTTYRDKASPAESAIATFKGRSWRQDPESCIVEALQFMEQVRLEIFVDKDLKFSLGSLHLDDFPAPASIDFSVRNWDISMGTFSPKLDERNVWNRAKAEYGFDPALNANAGATAIFRNQAAITQARKIISKKVVFPNLFEPATVILQIKEMLKMASAYSEFIDVVLTPRSAKKDIGQFVKLNINMGSSILQDVPCMIRELGYNAHGAMPVKLWSFQMLPYPGYSPGYAGIVGGSTAAITQE